MHREHRAAARIPRMVDVGGVAKDLVAPSSADGDALSPTHRSQE